MTRKDYEAIAAEIRKVITHSVFGYPKNSEAFGAQREIVSAVADAMARDNARFNRDRFLAACGFESR